jgi:hypothetical protein
MVYMGLIPVCKEGKPGVLDILLISVIQNQITKIAERIFA